MKKLLLFIIIFSLFSNFVISEDIELDVIIKFKDNDNMIFAKSMNVQDDFLEVKNEAKYEFNSFNGISTRISQKEYELLKNNPLIESISIGHEVTIFLDDSVPLIEANNVWNYVINDENLRGNDETICVIDTGVDYTHPDLGGCTTQQFLDGNCDKVIGGYNFVSNNNDPMDDNSHGTHVAGIIAANGTLKGVAPNARIVAVKVLNEVGSGDSLDVIAGIDYCIDNAETYNISVISLSLGSRCYNDENEWTGNCYNNFCDNENLNNILYTNVINNAVSKNISVVVATGNDGNRPGYAYEHISVPACITNSTRVGSSTISDLMSSFTNRWEFDMLLAPGSSIISTVLNGNSQSKSGTSMATPHVSGAIALLNQYLRLNDKELNPKEKINILNETGINIYDVNSLRDYSRININNAINSFNKSFNITLINPGNDSSLPFNYTTYFIINISAIGYYTNSIVCLLHINETDVYPSLNDYQQGNQNFSVNLSQYKYENAISWKVECSAIPFNSMLPIFNVSNNFILNNDNEIPNAFTVNLTNPLNASSYYFNTTKNLTFFINGDLDNYNCSLNINDDIIDNLYELNNYPNKYNFTVNLSEYENNLTWNVHCNASGNYFISFIEQNHTSKNFTIFERELPIIDEVNPIGITNNNSPIYTFNSTSNGTIIYLNETCESNITNALIGNNNITFYNLSDGIYDFCQIQIIDDLGGLSNILNISNFTIDTTPPRYNKIITSLPYNYSEENNYWFNITLFDLTEIDSIKLYLKNSTHDFVSYNLSNNSELWYYNITNLSISNYTYYFWGNDTLGNYGNITNLSYFNVNEINSSKEIILNQSNLIIDNNISTIIIDNNILKNISTTKNHTINLKFNNRPNNRVLFNSNITINRTINNKSIKLFIPKNTTMDLLNNSDGLFLLPNETTLNVNQKNISLAIKLGNNNEINFNNPIKLILPNQTGKKVSWISDSITNNITTICYNETFPNITSGDCKFDNDNDIIIWTYHLTTYYTYDDIIDAVCGTENGKVYSHSTNNWDSSNFCSQGNLVSTPSFPSQGNSVNWQCNGLFGGTNVQCSASRNNQPTTSSGGGGGGGSFIPPIIVEEINETQNETIEINEIFIDNEIEEINETIEEEIIQEEIIEDEIIEEIIFQENETQEEMVEENKSFTNLWLYTLIIILLIIIIITLIIIKRKKEHIKLNIEAEEYFRRIK